MFIKDNELHLVWCTQDVTEQAENNGTPITEKEALDCLGLMLKWHDCNNGTSWEDVHMAINQIIEERE